MDVIEASDGGGGTIALFILVGVGGVAVVALVFFFVLRFSKSNRCK